MKNFILFPTESYPNNAAKLRTEEDLMADSRLWNFISQAAIGDVIKTSNGLILRVGQNFPMPSELPETSEG